MKKISLRVQLLGLRRSVLTRVDRSKQGSCFDLLALASEVWGLEVQDLISAAAAGTGRGLDYSAENDGRWGIRFFHLHLHLDQFPELH